MLISTMNDIPGYEITEVLGEVFGLTVRARNVGSQIGAGLKSLVGGELKGMTKNLAASRQEVIQRMVEEATAKGAESSYRLSVRHIGNGRELDRDLCLRDSSEGAPRTGVEVAPTPAPPAPPDEQTRLTHHLGSTHPFQMLELPVRVVLPSPICVRHANRARSIAGLRRGRGVGKEHTLTDVAAPSDSP